MTDTPVDGVFGKRPKADITLPEFIQQMDEAGYLPVDTNALTSAYLTLQDMLQSPPEGGPVATLLLDGPPGAGKSYLAQSIAKLMGGQYLQYNCHPDSNEEEFLRDINFFTASLSQSGFLDEKPRFEDTFTHGQLFEAVRLSHQGPVVLLIDELDKARLAVDALLLGFLNDGYFSITGGDERFGVKQMKADLQNLIVIITKNDERDLTAALLRRARVVNMAYPPKNVEVRLLKERYGLGDEAAKAIVTKANALRGNPSIMKPPSPPEVARVACDFLNMAQKNVRTEATPDGHARLVCYVPKTILNQAFLNGMLALSEEHKTGSKIWKEKAAGQAFFHAILRGLWPNNSLPIHFVSEQTLIKVS